MFKGTFKGMFKDISKENKKTYEITNPGNYVFYFENKTDDITFEIICEDAVVYIYGLYQGKKNDVFNLNIIQKHLTPNSKSVCLIKSVLTDKSILNIKSTIDMTRDAHNCVSHFTNKNLLLSKSAQTIISPQLKVIPGDVECTHSSITAPLDNKQLQYLISRGIKPTKAKQLLIKGIIEKYKNIKKQYL